jgi:hypothetical protein
VVRGLAGAFRFFLRAFGAKWELMLGWVVGGGGLETNSNFGLGELYSVVVCGVPPGLLKYNFYVMDDCFR